MGVSRGQFIKLERGERGLTERTIDLAAKAFEVTKAEVLGQSQGGNEGTADSPSAELVRVTQGSTIPVAGTVEAGTFREADDSNQDEPEFVPAEPDKRWPDARQVAFRVAGDSMNALKPVPILEGATLICVDYEDIADRHPLRNGMIVVVERAALGGQMREWSVKQLEVLDDRFVFHPRSTSQKHKPIVVTTDFEADDGMVVSVLAIVRGILNRITE
ncbi:putative prophage repressor [Xanthobacter versatilis]|uniref:Putative prophage repressor n=1 Tax=Xanthobacter autotrophicus (strain ATCC BAA-1158 / Py2) TaxID=78245 RepID=A7ILE7_XANP2|nr:putative prophage repressor [Xanthobacter autotrophicus Py2]